mmetsp:Transcript_97970/g.277098  ORF Transcript_97970/g.277098 Transcript_97970/m.277098 type:complete len:151 (-) Transcript_97970:118-570(-)
MVHRLMPAQVEEYKKRFAEIDVDGSGAITADELGGLLGKCGQAPTSEQLTLMVAEADTNGDGSIDLNEFLLLMAEQSRVRDSETELKEAFKVFDQDNDGGISVADLLAALQALGENVTEEEIAEVIKGATDGKEAKLNYQQFERMLLSGK